MVKQKITLEKFYIEFLKFVESNTEEHNKTRKMITNLKKQNRQDHNMIIGNFDNRITKLENNVELAGGAH